MKRNQWSIFIAIHGVSLAYVNNVLPVLRTERCRVLYVYDICHIGGCHLLLEIVVCVAQIRL